MTNVERLSLADARRIALAAQGFGGSRPEAVTAARWLKTIDRLSLHQIDSVNVLVRAHYLPAFSRLGPYDLSLIDTAAWGGRKKRRLFEYWAHEASLLPLALHPLLRWRMARANRGEVGWKGLRLFAGERRPEADAILNRIRAEGPRAASDLEEKRGRSGWWQWGDAKQALEWLFWAGHITTATRRGSFERVYDLTERVIPAEILALPTPQEKEAHRILVDRAAQALGVATAQDLRDYFRLGPDDARQAIELARRGGRSRTGRGSRLGPPGLSSPRRPQAATHLRAGASGAVRSARLGALPHVAAFRLPLPDRDLHASRQAPARILCPPVSSRRPARRPARPEGRPSGRTTARPRGASRAARARRRHGGDLRGACRAGGLAWSCGGLIAPKIRPRLTTGERARQALRYR